MWPVEEFLHPISPVLRPPPDRTLARQCIHAYLAQGIGPDQKENTDGNDSFPYRQTGIIELISYAPTNGTRSRGDLYKMCGDWRNGWIRLDGIPIGRRKLMQ
jgi:hypothetical protein